MQEKWSPVMKPSQLTGDEISNGISNHEKWMLFYKRRHLTDHIILGFLFLVLFLFLYN